MGNRTKKRQNYVSAPAYCVIISVPSGSKIKVELLSSTVTLLLTIPSAQGKWFNSSWNCLENKL